MSGRRTARIASLALLLAAGAAAAQEPADTYADPVARELVARARERRGIIDRSITEYRTLSSERISVNYRLLGRERLLLRRESAARVHWRREGDTEIEVLGARQVVPIAEARSRIPGDLAEFMPHIAFDPLDSEFLFRIDTSFIHHPLAHGAERHYRYASGDSTVIRLPGGGEVKLRELRISPRRRDPHLIVGSFWIHTESYAVVQAAFRLARGYQLAEDESGLERALFSSMRADFSHFAVEYGLWDLRWWLPRSLVVAGVVELGRFGTLPMDYTRTYRAYEVVADSTRRVADAAAADSLRALCRDSTRFAFTVTVGDDSPDTASTAQARAQLRERAAQLAARDTMPGPCRRRYVVTIPDSVSDLIESDALPPNIYDSRPLLEPHEVEQLRALVERLPMPGWQLGSTRFEWPGNGPELLRYNAVEGLGLGARLRWDLGPAHAAVEGGYGVADEWPKAAATLAFEFPERVLTLRGYRDLHATDERVRPYAVTNSLQALLLGRDDALYYRAAGASLALDPAPARTQWYAVRLYFERQTAARTNTDFSLPHLFDDDFSFRHNLLADRAEQGGLELVLRTQYGQNPAALRAGAELGVRGEIGTFQFVRPQLRLNAALPPLGPAALALEAAAGTTYDRSPVQSYWQLGGTHSLRGYPTGIAAGRAFWRARGEVATALPLIRLALFSDVGWAGTPEGSAWRQDRPLLSAGAGLSLLDGTLRLDLARALRAPTGWRLHFYLGGAL